MKVSDYGNGQYYNEDFLKPGATSQMYLQQISYTVNLNDLFKFYDTCSYHQGMDFCPVIIELVDQNLKDHYKGNYLLQVWNKKGEKCYQKVLKYELFSWNIFHDYLLFKMNSHEEGSEWIYVVHLNQNGATLKVMDFSNDPTFQYLGINQQVLHFGSKNTIKMVDVKIPLADGEVKEVVIAKDQIITYKIDEPCRLLGFFENGYSRNDQYMLCIVETDDNQVDFSRLYFWDRDFDKQELTFYQYREVVRRDVRDDPIKKFRQIIISTEFQFGVALRKSGKIDLYWNFTLTNSPEGEYFTDVEVTYDKFYLIKRDSSRVTIRTFWDSRIGLDVATEFLCNDDQWHKIFYDQICYQVKISTAICLFSTILFVAHNNVVSLYDVIKKQWVKHFFFDDTVFNLCRNEKAFEVNNLGVYLKNGSIHIIDSDQQQEVWELMEGKQVLEGKVLALVSDWKTINTHYILIDVNGTYKLWGYSCQNLVDLTSHIVGLNPRCQLVRVFSPETNAHFMILDPDQGSISFYENQSYSGYFSIVLQQQYKINNMASELAVDSVIHSAIKTDNAKCFVLMDQLNYYKVFTEDLVMHKHEDQNVANICVLDCYNVYLQRNKKLKQEKEDNNSSFVYQDIGGFLNKGIDICFPLEDSIVGVNGLIDYNEDSNRIAYLINYEKIQIVPVLHRASNSFFGMKKRSEYITFRKVHDKLIGLDKNNVLTTWNVTTGKIIEQNFLVKQIDFSAFVVYKCEPADDTYSQDWYQPICLLRNQNEIPGYDQATYFDEKMLKTSLDNNTAYLKIVPKTFHEMKIIEIINEKEIIDHCTFIHPKYDDGNYQRIYFSDDKQYMLERLLNQRVFLYKREEQATAGMITWKMVRRIQQFPKDISELCYNNYLFSPDLMYYLDFDKSKGVFILKHTLTQQKYKSIPAGLMNPKKEEAVDIVKRFRWLDNNRIKIINRDGMEKVIDVSNNFQELSYGQVPQFDFSSYEDNPKSHYYFKKKEADITDTYLRLKRNYQGYKTAYYLDLTRTQTQLYDILFAVDFSIDNCNSKCVADLSFTFVHWRMIELMKTNKKFNMKQIGSKEAKVVVLNILPLFKTVLHHCSKRSSIQRAIYQIAAKARSKGENFIIPFIKNYKNQSPLHLCLIKNNPKSADTFLKNLQDEDIDSHARAIYDILPKCVEAELPSLGQYLDSRFLQTEQIKGIRRGCLNYRGTMEYVVNVTELWPDNKAVEDKLLIKNPKESEIKLELLDVPAFHCYQEKSSDEFFEALGETSDIKIFGQKSIQAMIDFKWPLAKEYTIKFLFIPFIFFQATFIVYQNVFFGQVGAQEEETTTEETTDSTVADAARRLLQDVIEEAAESTEPSSSLSDPGDNLLIASYVLSVILILFSVYFLINEFRQVLSSGLDYLKSVWNYCDFIPPMLIIITVILHVLELDNDIKFVATMRALASLLMWAKLLYFLRIFSLTGYLIRMLTDVIYGMRIFLLILLIVYFAFGEAFLRLSEQSQDEAQFITNYADAIVYAFRMSVGDGGVDTYNDTIQPVTAWILMVLCSLITSIVMLNLLIAIISEKFAEINEDSVLANYQEKARIIAENSYLIPNYAKASFCPKKKYLIVAEEVGEKDEILDVKEEIATQLRQLETAIAGIKAEHVHNKVIFTEKIELIMRQI